jgi:predicted small metal-binding protein
METDSAAQDTSNLMEIIIKHNKDEHKIKISPKATLNDLRKSIQDVTQILPGLQKLMFKGILKGEDKTLEELGVKPNTRIMVVGSSLHEVMSLSAVPSGEEKKRLEEEPANTNPLSEQLPHKKIIDKGVPEGADQGYKGRNVSNRVPSPCTAHTCATGSAAAEWPAIAAEQSRHQSASVVQSVRGRVVDLECHRHAEDHVRADQEHSQRADQGQRGLSPHESAARSQ